MGSMTGRASLDSRRAVLEDEWAAFVGMAGRTLLLLEAAEQGAGRRRVRVVAGDAFQCTLAEPMMLVELELRELVGVTVRANGAAETEPGEIADCATRLAQQVHWGRTRSRAVLTVAIRTCKAGERVRASVEARVRFTVAGQTSLILRRCRFLTKCEHAAASAARANMLGNVPVAIETARREPRALLPPGGIQLTVGIVFQGRELVAMASRAQRGRACACSRGGLCVNVGER